VISRFLSFLSLLAFGAAIGFSWAVMGDKQRLSLYVLAGALLAGLCWVLLDAWRGYRVRSWLRQGDLAMAPQLSGWWGVVLDRARKLLRERERSIDAGEQRLKDFLSAIQASPNGCLLYTSDAADE
jgi:two-component system phosphate regulon sensor histidine kinase PhoR